MVEAFSLVGLGSARVATALVEELGRRGYRVAVIKAVKTGFHPVLDTSSQPFPGASTTVAVSQNEVRVMRYEVKPTLNTALGIVSDVDVALAEGFEETHLPTILCLPEPPDTPTAPRGPLIAVMGETAGSYGLDIGVSLGLPILRYDAFAKLADVVENQILLRLVRRLPGLDCGRCGYPTCKAFAEAVLEKGLSTGGCEALSEQDVVLEVDGETIPIVRFVQNLVKNTVMGLISTLKGVSERVNRGDRLRLRIEISTSGRAGSK